MRDQPGVWQSAETLTVLILARNEADNLERLLPQLADVLSRSGVAHDVVVVDAQSPDGTAAVAQLHGARVVQQREKGYANALRQGIAQCAGDFVLTLDADLSHPPHFVIDMLAARHTADVVIASRYVAGGSAVMPASRRLLSAILNRTFAGTLRLAVRDLSSGFRLYRRDVLAGIATRGTHFDVLPEIVAIALRRGFRTREIPFRYEPRVAGVSKARVLSFASSYLCTLWRCAVMRP
jgi:glycosyltransferase involved in cell wall biosynthesis